MRTSPPVFWAMAGTSPGWAMPTTWTCSTAPSASSATSAIRPTLIIVHSHIGWVAKRSRTPAPAHGEPLGEEEVRLDEAQLPLAGGREVPRTGRGLRALPPRVRLALGRLLDAWFARVEGYKAAYPDLAMSFTGCSIASSPEGWDSGLPAFPADRKGMATRNSSGLVLNAVAGTSPG